MTDDERRKRLAEHIAKEEKCVKEIVNNGEPYKEKMLLLNYNSGMLDALLWVRGNLDLGEQK